MSDTSPRESGISVTMSEDEWQLVFQAIGTAPLPLFRSQVVALKLQQQVSAQTTRQRANGQLPEQPVENAP